MASSCGGIRRSMSMSSSADIFNGSIDMFHSYDARHVKRLDLGRHATIDINNGFVAGVFPAPSIPAGTSTIAGASFSQNSGTINVVDDRWHAAIRRAVHDERRSLREQRPGGVQFEHDHYRRGQYDDADCVVEPDESTRAHTVTINQTNFNLDGQRCRQTSSRSTGGSVLEHQHLATTTLMRPPTRSTARSISIDGTINRSTSTDPEFVMDGVLNMHTSVGSDQSLWTGDALDIGNDAGALDADVNVMADRSLRSLATSGLQFRRRRECGRRCRPAASLFGRRQLQFRQRRQQCRVHGRGESASAPASISTRRDAQHGRRHGRSRWRRRRRRLRSTSMRR